MEEMDGKLDDRWSLVLRLVIEDYIETAEPVGSRTISKKMEQSLSPATIRNIMADLEEMGFLAQPHTSAGRVPVLCDPPAGEAGAGAGRPGAAGTDGGGGESRRGRPGAEGQPRPVGSFRSGVRGGRVPRVAPAAPVAEPPAGVQRQDPAGDRPPGGVGPEPAGRRGAGRLRRGA